MLVSKEIAISDKISVLTFWNLCRRNWYLKFIQFSTPISGGQKHVCCIHLLFSPPFASKSFFFSERLVVLQRVFIIIIRKIKTCLQPSTISHLNNEGPVVKSTEHFLYRAEKIASVGASGISYPLKIEDFIRNAQVQTYKALVKQCCPIWSKHRVMLSPSQWPRI